MPDSSEQNTEPTQTETTTTPPAEAPAPESPPPADDRSFASTKQALQAAVPPPAEPPPKPDEPEKPWYSELNLPADEAAWAARFRSLPEALRGGTESFKLASRKGLTPPKALTDYAWPKIQRSNGQEEEVFADVPKAVRERHSERLFKLGVPTEMFSQVNVAFQETLEEYDKEAAKELQRSIHEGSLATAAKLREEFGGPIAAEQAYAGAELLVEQLGLSGMVKEYPVLMAREDFVLAMCKLAKATSDSTLIRGQSTSALNLQAELDRLRVSKDYRDPGAAGHPAAKKRYDELIEAIYKSTHK